MAASQLVEKLKFRDKFVLVNIVVMPLSKSLESNTSEKCALLARNKFLTCDVWETFVYKELYTLFYCQFDGTDNPVFKPNEEYTVTCTERPYLEMKCTFRDKTYRDILNILVKEDPSKLYETSIEVEISDIGRYLLDKLDEQNKMVLRLFKENDALKCGENASIKNQKQTVDTRAAKNHSESDGDERHGPADSAEWQTKGNGSELSLSSKHAKRSKYTPNSQKPTNGNIDPNATPEVLGGCAKRERLPRSSKTSAIAWLAENLKEV